MLGLVQQAPSKLRSMAGYGRDDADPKGSGLAHVSCSSPEPAPGPRSRDRGRDQGIGAGAGVGEPGSGSRGATVTGGRVRRRVREDEDALLQERAPTDWSGAKAIGSGRDAASPGGILHVMDEVSIGELASLPEGQPTLRKGGDRRFVCVRRGDAVDVLDDRCPHEGYPLSQGDAQDGVLTCHWHNWKFETATGACLFGGEAVRRFPCRVDGGEVLVDLRVDVAKERRRLRASLAAAQREGSAGAAMREALRLEALEGDLTGAFEAVAQDAAARARYGFDHGLALLADVIGAVDDGRLRPHDGFAAGSGWVAEPMVLFPERRVPAPRAGEPSEVVDALDADRREDAEAIARHLVRAGRWGELRDALLGWLARDLTDYGHGLIYLTKADELTARFDDAAEAIVGALVHALSWATIDSALPGWKATHEGTRTAPVGGESSVDDAYLAAVLESERAAVTACLERLHAGASPIALLEQSARAAAIRLSRFDDAWQLRADAPVTVLDVSHALTFAEAALAASDALPAGSPLPARFAVQSAGFVGQLAAADGPTVAPILGGSLDEALATRDLGLALGALDGLDAGELHARLMPFCSEHAFVRPIFAAHAIKTAEAARRLELRRPDHARDHRAAILTLVVPRRPERVFHRTATVAARFLEDGRPPPGLY